MQDPKHDANSLRFVAAVAEAAAASPTADSCNKAVSLYNEKYPD